MSEQIANCEGSKTAELRIADSPSSVGRWAKALVLLWGLAVFLPVLPLAPAFCCMLEELLRYNDAGARAFGLGIAALMAVGLVCGGTMLFQGASALSGKPSRRLRLPPLWGVLGGFVLALVTGLGLGQVEGLSLLLGPWFIVAAAALAPLTAIVWAADERAGGLTWRRAGVAFSAGATVSVILAIALEILAPLSIIWLLLDLGAPVLDALEGLVDLLAGGEVASALSSSGFLLALFELAVVAPLVEEFAKSLVVLPLLRGAKSRRDVFLLGAMAGAGFAAVENVIYALVGGQYWGGILLVRALGAAVHPLGTGLMALAWSDPLGFKNPKGLLAALAVGQHALWNGGLVLWMALSGAAFFGPEPWRTNVMGVSIAVGMLALVALEGVALWVAMGTLSQRLDPAKAPVEKDLGLSTERTIALWAVVCLMVLLPVGMAVLRGLWFR